MKLTESQLRQIIGEVINESLQDGTLDEGRFGNFLSSVGSGIKGTLRGGFDQGRQDYNDTMSQRSQADADAAAAKAQEYSSQMNNGYADIPAVQKIAQKYDGKINALQQQIQQLTAQKKEEMQQARRQYMRQMGKQASKYGNQSNQYAQRAQSADAAARKANQDRWNNLNRFQNQAQDSAQA